ncbi:MAG: OmpH family outer membrane protein [Roseicyclus sp.]
MGRRTTIPFVLLITAGLAFAGPVSAQDSGGTPGTVPVLPVAPPEIAPSPVTASIVVLNQERLLSQSLYGQRIQRELEAAGAMLRAENRDIEVRLSDEELRLTELRRTLPIDEFRPMAEEFDDRVEGIRAAQEAKGRALQQQSEAAQARFFEIAFPILLEIVSGRGAAVLMDSRAVLLSADGVDITAEALARIDAEIGEGGPEPLIDLDGSRAGPVQRPDPDADAEPAPPQSP